jgi:hypothetical protein
MNKRTLAGLIISIAITTVTLPTLTLQTCADSSTLADSLKSVINNVNWSGADSWTSLWGQILADQSPSAFDNVISSDVSTSNYADALYVARLADLNGYTSPTIQNCIRAALENVSMCGSLPANCNAQAYGDPGSSCFEVYGRYLLWAYQYAQKYGLTVEWNVTQAFLDFARMYDKPPINSASGEMLWCDPANNWAESYSSRYYDEHAETLSTFLQFEEQGVPAAINYADKAWTGVQAHWNGQYYGYAGTSTVECEMGNFAQIIAEYAQQKGGTIPYWSRVIQDLNYKLLANGWSSPGWATAGVLMHAKGVNSELRLWETMGAVTALQELYQNFTATMQTSLQSMLMGSSTTSAWQGLMSSSLNVSGRFKGTSSDSSPSNDATVVAAAILFLDGIVPLTGSLAIPFREENYNDDRTMYQTAAFRFDYANRSITIPVNAGTLAFIYGNTPVNYTFPANGVYTIQFSNDWNTITAVRANANYALHLSTGWNMVSFPIIPGNATFASIFTGVGFYQALTWNGSSYVDQELGNVTAGAGYWVLVLSDTTVNVAGTKVESYELDLPAGWSMIGSICNATIDSSTVFSSYYELLTWSGTGYVSATTIEPGRGYWALVLTPTHVTLPP